MDEHPDVFAPVLPGEGASDYERYLRTAELLALQKPPAEMAHRDELLFTVVHQSSELWLKLASFELEETVALLRVRNLAAANRLVRRALACLANTTAALDMLEHMSAWEYQVVRTALGHGSGFDSPGFKTLRAASVQLGVLFHDVLRDAGLTVVELIQHGREHEELYTLEELLVEWDERMTMWRLRHVKVIQRVIGAGAVGTQGTPVELLVGLLRHNLYPELWQARNELTGIAGLEP